MDAEGVYPPAPLQIPPVINLCNGARRVVRQSLYPAVRSINFGHFAWLCGHWTITNRFPG